MVFKKKQNKKKTFLHKKQQMETDQFHLVWFQ